MHLIYNEFAIFIGQLNDLCVIKMQDNVCFFCYAAHGTFTDSESFVQPASLQEEWGERCSVGFLKQPGKRKRKLIYTPPQLEDSFLFGESEGNEVGWRRDPNYQPFALGQDASYMIGPFCL